MHGQTCVEILNTLEINEEGKAQILKIINMISDELNEFSRDA